jgi:hypothetical protein
VSDTSVTPHASSIGGDLLARLADFGLVLLREWWNEGLPGDIDGGWVQGVLFEHGLYVSVPAGTHTECESCEDGRYECGELAPGLREALEAKTP